MDGQRCGDCWGEHGIWGLRGNVIKNTIKNHHNIILKMTVFPTAFYLI